MNEEFAENRTRWKMKNLKKVQQVRTGKMNHLKKQKGNFQSRKDEQENTSINSFKKEKRK